MMSGKAPIAPLPKPILSPLIDASTVVAGPPIPALDRIKLFSSKQWEEFVLEWADSLLDKYSRVDRCGGGLPLRPAVPPPPAVPGPTEARYLGHLWAAYADHLNTPVTCQEDLGAQDELVEHLKDARVEFFSAEALRSFSRDTLPPGAFEQLQDELHSGIKDELRAPYPDGYYRVLGVVRTARSLQLTSHPLISKISVRDRGGLCHQLANDDKVVWVRKK
jgi:hypothetical protein